MKKTALITGSSRGIGKAIALRLAKEGYNIILHGSQMSEALLSTEKEVKKIGAHSLTSCFDVTNKSEVDAACSLILKKVGRVSVLVNNAGIIRDTLFSKMSEKEWDMVIKTNLYGAFYVTRQILPSMQENKFGRIINLSSIAAKGAFGKTNYAAAKAGLIALTKSLALEVGKYDITVNAVCPGYIDTEMSASIPAKYRKQFLSEIALRRIGKPSEVAGAVAYLAGNDGAYITGAVIDVNGGWM
jgi:NAD(P)-dependent dehydrogenase (short-subunit alcohol dehydrogenase family)